MATKLPTAPEKVLQKIQDKTSCGICLGPYKHPKLLSCFHAFCEQCLKNYARKSLYNSISCPNCRRETRLPTCGVSELQSAFYLDTLLEIQEIVKTMSVGDSCPKHPDKEADFYCEQCDELICSYCLVPAHRDHHYDLRSNAFAKHDKVIDTALKPILKQINALTRGIESVKTRCDAVAEQKSAIVEKINTTMTYLRQVIKARQKELINQAESRANKKLKALNVQRDEFQVKLRRLQSCYDSVAQSRRTCSQGEILKMKGHLLKQIENMAVSFNPETLIIAKQADIQFYHTLPDIVKMCQEFGMVFSYSLYPEKCRASGEGITIATNGETSCVSVEVFDGEGEAYLTPVDDLKYELRGKNGILHVSGTGTRRYHNVYDIRYEPHTSGLYKLDIQVEGRPIINSPFPVTVLPSFIEAAECIENAREPIGIAVMDGGEGLVVAEYGNHCVSIINRDREKETSFGTRGSASGQFDKPEGVAIDRERNILVADLDNHRIQQFSSAGEFLRSVGQYGSRPLQFRFPRDVTVHPHTHKVYVADWGNHRIQILNSGLTYFSSFGRIGCGKGEFNGPCDIASDPEGNLSDRR